MTADIQPLKGLMARSMQFQALTHTSKQGLNLLNSQKKTKNVEHKKTSWAPVARKNRKNKIQN